MSNWNHLVIFSIYSGMLESIIQGSFTHEDIFGSNLIRSFYSLYMHLLLLILCVSKNEIECRSELFTNSKHSWLPILSFGWTIYRSALYESVHVMRWFVTTEKSFNNDSLSSFSNLNEMYVQALQCFLPHR